MVITIDYWRLLVPERDDTHMIMEKGQFNSPGKWKWHGNGLGTRLHIIGARNSWSIIIIQAVLRSYGSEHTLRLENQQCKQQRKSILGYGEPTHSSVTMRRLDSTHFCTTWSVISTQLETSRMLTRSLVRIPKQWRDTGPSSNTSQLSPLYWLTKFTSWLA